MNTIIPERLAEIAGLRLKKGSHEKQKNAHEMCVMELFSYVSGEPWRHTPICACPVITTFLVGWNDTLEDEDRVRLLRPLIPLIVGTRHNNNLAERRSYMALDWLIRTNLPTWLGMVPALHSHGVSLREMNEISDITGAVAAGVKVNAALAVAGDAEWEAAWAAVGGPALNHTIARLQASAVDLVKRMCEVRP